MPCCRGSSKATYPPPLYFELIGHLFADKLSSAPSWRPCYCVLAQEMPSDGKFTLDQGGADVLTRSERSVGYSPEKVLIESACT